jgi:hypothetical protein
VVETLLGVCGTAHEPDRITPTDGGGIMATEKLSYSQLGEATELLTGEHCGNRAVTGW